MPSPETATLIIVFDEEAPHASRLRPLALLGLPSGPDMRVRWHEPGLVTARLAAVPDPGVLEELEGLPGVRRIRLLRGGERLVTTGGTAPEAIFAAAGERKGDTSVIAGPCSVESESQVLDIARFVKSAGAVALRGGAFKPRTSPYAFGGLGTEGLRLLARAREETGLPIVTEVLDAADLDLVAEVADVLQIGSRNMHCYPLLYRVGRNRQRKPILLKRGFAATLEEFLDAAEYVALGQLAAGRSEPCLMLCERGLRSPVQSTRFSLDVGAVPALQAETRLPVIVDPSHPAGLEPFVLPLASAALAAGADGLLVEVHFDPASAWCDGPQSLGYRQFESLMQIAREQAALRPARFAVRLEA